MLTDVQLAWAAGFIDGEGTISMYTKAHKPYRPGYSIRLSVVNTYLPSLERLQVMFGGSIQPLHSEERSYGENWKPSFFWSCGAKATEAALTQLLPHLFVKRPQAELALEARSLVGSKGEERSEKKIEQLESTLQRFRELNRKGRVTLRAI